MSSQKFQKTIFFILLILTILGCSTKSTTLAMDTEKKYAYIIKVNINASKEKVWQTITDFKHYSQWNSVLKMQNNDKLTLGEKFDVTIFAEDGSISDTFEATAITKMKDHSFSASQVMLSDSLFKATHHFEIQEVSKNKVTFIQKWEFNGVLGYLFEGMIIDVLQTFKKMNAELKKEIEQK